MGTCFFLRIYDQQEIDWIEDRGGILHAYEFEWNPNRKAKEPIAWKKAYQHTTFGVIHRDNYGGWINI